MGIFSAKRMASNVDELSHRGGIEIAVAGFVKQCELSELGPCGIVVCTLARPAVLTTVAVSAATAAQ